MSYIRTMYEVSKDKYDKLITIERKNTKKFHKMVEEIAYKSPFPPNAYDCAVPMEVFQLSGKYYVSWNRWDSCN